LNKFGFAFTGHKISPHIIVEKHPKQSSRGFHEFYDRNSFLFSRMIADYGTPEEADLMSGAVYMHASLTEDKCSQVRIHQLLQYCGPGSGI